MPNNPLSACFVIRDDNAKFIARASASPAVWKLLRMRLKSTFVALSGRTHATLLVSMWYSRCW